MFTKSFLESTSNHENPDSTKKIQQILEKIYRYNQQQKDEMASEETV